MFTTRTLNVRRPSVRPPSDQVPDNVLALIARMRIMAAGDIRLAKLLEELDGYLPAPNPPR